MEHPEFAARFKEAVRRAGVEDTQEALARLFGVSPVTIWAYRNGMKLPRMSTAIRISEKLGVSTEWLLNGTGRGPSHIVAEEPGVYSPGASQPTNISQLAPEIRELLLLIQQKAAEGSLTSQHAAVLKSSLELMTEQKK